MAPPPGEVGLGLGTLCGRPWRLASPRAPLVRNHEGASGRLEGEGVPGACWPPAVLRARQSGGGRLRYQEACQVRQASA
eukprot:9564982-Lingulodinium_polyedra.AAC.1